ncbi:MAG TPA: ATP12 family protein [Xanthobacteraceae bacterium]|jgi:chaperone required for assembly of F1-ATPase|nr:ATP12 family protein [Xanthobacteraceae bacterium]
MRDIFEDIFAQPPIDPIETARRSARPQLRRRFYKSAQVEDSGRDEHGFAVRLDGRAVRTPARHVLEVPARALAEAIAAEWNAQGDVIDPAKMPLTRLANSIIDGVAAAPAEVAAEIARYLASDLLVYRATGPQELVARQAQAWNPLLVWAREKLAADFVTTQGVNFIVQPPAAIKAATEAIPRDPWRLGALSTITTLTGSALIALALLSGRLSAEEAWAAAHIDEDWNMELWGRDALALERRAAQFAEVKSAALVLAALRQESS